MVIQPRTRSDQLIPGSHLVGLANPSSQPPAAEQRPSLTRRGQLAGILIRGLLYENIYGSSLRARSTGLKKGTWLVESSSLL
jgi:hypothetical protein